MLTKTDIYFELQEWLDNMKNFNDLQYGKARIKTLQQGVMSDLLDEHACDGVYFFNDTEVWEVPGNVTPVSVHTKTERRAVPALGKWIYVFKRPQSGFFLVRHRVPCEDLTIAIL